MSKFYTRIVKGLINDPAVPDDGSETAANQGLWSLIKSKIFDGVVTEAQKLDTNLEAAFLLAELGASSLRVFSPATGYSSYGTYSFASATRMAMIILVGSGGEHENALIPSGAALASAGNGGGSGEVKIQMINGAAIGGQSFQYEDISSGAAVPTFRYTDDAGNSLTVVGADQYFGVDVSQAAISSGVVGTEQISINGGLGNYGDDETGGGGAASTIGRISPQVDDNGTSFGHGRNGANINTSFDVDDAAGLPALIVVEFE